MLSKLMKKCVIITILAIIAGCGDSESQQASVTFNKEKTFILKNILVNLATSESPNRFVGFDIAFEFNNKDMAPYFLPASEENKSSLGDKIKAEVIMLIKTRTYQQAKNKEDREVLLNQIRVKINNIFLSHFKGNKNMEKWKVESVSFLRFG